MSTPAEQPAPSGRSAWIARIVLLLIVLALGYGVYWLFIAAHASDKPLSSTSDLEAACFGSGGRKYFPTTAAYEGKGPHPIAFFKVSASGSMMFDGTWPSGTPEYWNGVKLDPNSVQLIACAGDVSDGPSLGDCEFTSDSLPLYQGKYTITLREAKTGAEVASIPVDGKASKSCPGLVYTKGESAKLHTDIDFADYKSALEKYVEGEKAS